MARCGDEAERSKRRQRRMVVYASLFGVGAPEALVIGVVALLVFGPKGLAEVSPDVFVSSLLIGLLPFIFHIGL